MKKLNVVDLLEFKEQREKRLVEQGYGHYVKSLRDEQLPTELRHLQELSSNSEFIKKGLILSKEFASRATDSIRGKIEKMHDETLRLLD